MDQSLSPTSDLKPFTARLADYLVLAKVRQALGFAKCQKSFYGAAPMTAETQHFFLGLNIRLYAGYGLSETSGPHFMSSPYNYRLYRYVCAHMPLLTSLVPTAVWVSGVTRSILGWVHWRPVSHRWSAPKCHGALAALGP